MKRKKPPSPQMTITFVVRTGTHHRAITKKLSLSALRRLKHDRRVRVLPMDFSS